jgi:hypothetical protein
MIRRVLVKQTLWRRVLNYKKIPGDIPVVSEEQSPDNKDSLSSGFLYGIDIEQIRDSGDSDQIKSLFSKPSKITPRNSHDNKK